MKVYIVTSGEYYAYSIEDVFLDKAKAERYVSLYKDMRIEEYETVDDTVGDGSVIHGRWVTFYAVSGKIEGKVFVDDPVILLKMPEGFEGERVTRYGDGYDKFIWFIRADNAESNTPERARKIASERYAQYAWNSHATSK